MRITFYNYFTLSSSSSIFFNLKYKIIGNSILKSKKTKTKKTTKLIHLTITKRKHCTK